MSQWLRPPGPVGRRGRGWSRRARYSIIAFCLIFMLVLAMGFVDFMLRDAIAKWAESRAINIATRAISLAVSENLAQQIESNNLAREMRDESGKIVGFRYAMGDIARIEAEAARWVQQALQVLAEENLPLPMGQLAGMDWLAGYGPQLPVRIVPVGSVTTAPKSEFRSAGINQVLHRIYVEVNVDMKVVAPLVGKDFPVHQQIVVSEQVYIGEVPQFYFNWQGTNLDSLGNDVLELPLN